MTVACFYSSIRERETGRNVRKPGSHSVRLMLFIFCFVIFILGKMWRKNKVCVLHFTWWIIETVAEMPALFIEETTEKDAVHARPATVKGCRRCCHLSPRSPERQANKSYISSIMWLLLRLVCLGLRGESSLKHQLLNREWTLAIPAVPVNPFEWRESAVMLLNTNISQTAMWGCDWSF